jgi:hypothetical protein
MFSGYKLTQDESNYFPRRLKLRRLQQKLGRWKLALDKLGG